MSESIRDRLRREIMAEWKDAMRRAILKHWIRDNSRDLAWVTQQIGYTEAYITAVLEGRRSHERGADQSLCHQTRH